METVYSGLTNEEVLVSRKAHGVNILMPHAKAPLWKQYLEKFEDPLIIILLIAGTLSVCISCYEYFGVQKTVFHVNGCGAFVIIAALIFAGQVTDYQHRRRVF